MANFHPSDNLLLEYSAGSLDWALGICISAHLQFCPHCKHKVMQFNAIGASFLNHSRPMDVGPRTFDKLMRRIKSTQSTEETRKHTEPLGHDERAKTLPQVVQKLLPKDKPLKWSYVSPALRSAHLVTGQSKYEVCFHRLKRGGKAVQHDHRGLEITLVLEGSFSDEDGNYVPGDFIEKNAGQIHRPMAAQDKDCLCLSVVEAPVKVTGLMGKIINPFLTICPE